MKKLMRMAGIAAAGAALGGLLLAAVFLIPVDRMQGHLRESVQLLEYEFDNNTVIFGYPFTLTGLFTDCIMLQSAVYENGEHSLAEAALGVYRREADEGQWAPGEALVAYLNGQAPPCEVDYARYWHGYLVFLKPLLCIFNLSELRLFGVIVQGVLVAAVLWGFYRRRRMREGMAFLATLLVMMPLSMMLSLSLSVCSYIMFGAVLLQLFFHDRFRRGGYPYFFLIVGMSAAYFDLLTYPLITLGIPLTVGLVLERDRERSGMKAVLEQGISWAAGYGLMWAAKWALADLFLHRGVIGDALSTLFARTGTVGGQSRVQSFLTALGSNIGALCNWPYLLLLLLGLALLVWDCLRSRLNKRPGKEKGAAGLNREEQGQLSGLPGEKRGIRETALLYLPYGVVALLPAVWYFLAANHSAEHWMFTCRILGISVFALLCALLKWRRPGEGK